MPARDPNTPAGFGVPHARSHTHQPQPSRHPDEKSRVGHQTQHPHGQRQITRYELTPSGLVKITRKQGPTTHQTHGQAGQVQHQPSPSVRPQPSYQNAGLSDGFVTEKGHHKQPNPGPPDGYIKENGREIPIWYNPPGIVDKDMTSTAQVEYNRVRKQITNGRR